MCDVDMFVGVVFVFVVYLVRVCVDIDTIVFVDVVILLVVLRLPKGSAVEIAANTT